MSGYLPSVPGANTVCICHKKHPIPVNTSSNSFCTHFVISVLAFLLLSLLGPGRKYSISLLFNGGVLSALLLKFELPWLFAFVSVFGPGIEHSISLLFTVGLRTSSGLLFKFELLLLFVQQFVLLFVLAQYLSRPVFAQHCSLPALKMLSSHVAICTFFISVCIYCVAIYI